MSTNKNKGTRKPTKPKPFACVKKFLPTGFIYVQVGDLGLVDLPFRESWQAHELAGLINVAAESWHMERLLALAGGDPTKRLVAVGDADVAAINAGAMKQFEAFHAERCKACGFEVHKPTGDPFIDEVYRGIPVKDMADAKGRYPRVTAPKYKLDAKGRFRCESCGKLFEAADDLLNHGAYCPGRAKHSAKPKVQKKDALGRLDDLARRARRAGFTVHEGECVKQARAVKLATKRARRKP